MHRRLVASATAAFLLPVGLAAAPTTGAAAEPTAPESAGRTIGSWSVSPAGPDTWSVAWTAPEPLMVGGDQPRILTSEDTGRAPAGTDLGSTTLSPDGRTVTVTVVGSKPRPTSLDVVLSGRTLDEPVEATTPTGSARFTAPERELLPVDPGIPGDVPFTTRDYTLDPITVDGMPIPVEMVGHVVAPTPAAAEADDPLVLLLHGKHGTCFVGDEFPTYAWPCKGEEQPLPNHLGYEYLQELLASQGYVTVSISANAINAQDTTDVGIQDSGAAARAQLVQAHLDQWAAWDQAGQEIVDLDDVVLVGHSRGGEGVARASLEIPLDAAYRISGQVLIGPTDFARQTSPYVPTVSLLPYCDGDVYWLGGQTYTDRARDLTTDDTSMKSSVMLMGANHNFFNTEWTPGLSQAMATDDVMETSSGACAADAPTRLSAQEQQDVGKAYIAGAVRMFTESDAEDKAALLPMYDGSAARVASAGDAVVLSHMLGGGRTTVRPGIDASPADGATATVGLCVGATPFTNTGQTCGRYARDYGLTPHWPATGTSTLKVKALQMGWTSPGAAGGLALDEPLDLTGAAALDLRTIVDPRIGDVELEVRIGDASGGTTQVAGVTGATLSALPVQSDEHGGRYWAQTLRVDPAGLEGVDLDQVTTIELVGLSDTGRVLLLDASAVPVGLPGVPAKRMPFVDMGSAEIKEGPAGTHVAEVPFDVVGDLTVDATLRVYEENAGVDESPATPTGVTHLVQIPAGSTGGTFEVEYTGNDEDSVTPRLLLLLGHGVTEVLTRDYQGELAIVDDDPSPRLRFRALDSVVSEGDTSTWVVRLVGSKKRGLMVGLRPVAGDGTPLTVNDVPKRWLNQVITLPPGDHALHSTNMTLWADVSDFQRKAVFEVPIRDDHVKEGAETLTFRLVTNTGYRSRPLAVTIRRSP